MKRSKKLMGLTAVIMGVVMATAACGSSGGAAETKAADSAASTEAATEAAGGDTSAAGDLNSKTVDELTEAAKAEGEVVSVGMPDEWADWASLWKTMSDTYGISHNDTDMSSSEELQMFATEGEKGTKDIGDVGYGFAGQAVSEDLVQGYKTSYWDSVPDWAKGEDGKWMVAYTGVTTFLVNTDQVDKVPTSWQDIKDGDYKVALGPLTGGNAQAAFIASAYAFGGDMNNLDPAFEFWTELAKRKAESIHLISLRLTSNPVKFLLVLYGASQVSLTARISASTRCRPLFASGWMLTEWLRFRYQQICTSSKCSSSDKRDNV